ncbi:MAG: hypothetical protein VKJ64_09285, partial [Leptolyngbyaceae bacterium]|nr:hypothetical protein [Leptolyngbyaceae bacterium]
FSIKGYGFTIGPAIAPALPRPNTVLLPSCQWPSHLPPPRWIATAVAKPIVGCTDTPTPP